MIKLYKKKKISETETDFINNNFILKMRLKY